MDDLDVCTLSYLPCNINVYLDDYDGSKFTCAFIYLNEIRINSDKIILDDLKSLTLDEFAFKRDVECKLKETLKECFKQTTNNKCVYKTINFDENNRNNSLVLTARTSLDDQEDIELFADLKVDLKSNETSNLVSNDDDDDDDEMYAFLEISELKSSIRTTEPTTSTNIIITTTTTDRIIELFKINSTTLQNEYIINNTTNIIAINESETIQNEMISLNNNTEFTNESNQTFEMSTQIIISEHTKIPLRNFTKEMSRFNEIIDYLNNTNNESLSNNNNKTNRESLFYFENSSISNESYDNLLIIFKISISLLAILLFLMSITNLYLLYWNRLTKSNFNRVNISTDDNENKIALKGFGFMRNIFLRENSVSSRSQN